MSYAPRILLVEDEAGVRRLFERVLSEDGYYVATVATGRHALWVLRDTSFDLAIVDMSLPDLDGPCLIREITTEYPHVDVLASSGAMERHMEALAHAAGAIRVFQKPIPPDKLRKVVYAALDPSYAWRGGAPE